MASAMTAQLISTPPAEQSVARDSSLPSPMIARLTYIILLIPLIYLAGYKPIGISADLHNYELLYGIAGATDWFTLRNASDPAYYMLSKFVAEWGLSFEQFALIIAAITCAMKIRIAQSLDTNRIVFGALYMSYLFWLHEYTQIRLAIALAFVLWGIYKPSRLMPLFLLVGMLLHSSTAMIVILYLICRFPLYGTISAFAVVVSYFTSPALRQFAESAANKVLIYQDLVNLGQFSEINIFNLLTMTQVATMMIALPFLKGMTKMHLFEVVTSIAGVIMFYVFRDNPVVAFRTNELSIPFFEIFLARMWSRHPVFKGLAAIYFVIGLRSAFFSASSLIVF